MPATAAIVKPAPHDPLADIFPDVPPPFKPVGRMVLIQEKCQVSRRASGLILAPQVLDGDRYVETRGKVVGMGQRCFVDEFGGEVPREFGIGDYVIIPRFDSDKHQIDHPTDSDTKVVFRVVPYDRVWAVVTDEAVLTR